jgi:hypothetical protein
MKQLPRSLGEEQEDEQENRRSIARMGDRSPDMQKSNSSFSGQWRSIARYYAIDRKSLCAIDRTTLRSIAL